MSAPDPLPQPRIHPTALLEEGVVVGPGTAIWDHAHIRSGAEVGSCCILGEKVYIAYDVRIGDFVKINAAAYVCAGTTIEDGVMIAAHVVFTNDRLPRATDPEITALRSSEPGPHTLSTTVRRGATVGANATIGPGVTLGEFCTVGMGAVVTRDVPAHGLVLGNPARLHGLVCRCGQVVVRLEPGQLQPDRGVYSCPDCLSEVAWPPASQPPSD